MELKDLFDNSTVRRQDRLLDYDSAEKLLLSAEYGFLSFGGEARYGIPISFALKGTSLYFHCATEGEKLKRMKKNNQVCFCVVGNTELQPAQFTTTYESVLTFGQVYTIEEDDERMMALELIVDKYSPDFKETGRKYAEKSFHKTVIFCLDIARITGKTRIIPRP